MTTIQLQNIHITSPDTPNDDYLYHLDMSSRTHDLPAKFGDVKFVCMGGKQSRMLEFITYITDVLDLPRPKDGVFCDYAQSGGRYALYKNGPVISVSHGIGFASLSVVLTELIKLLYYAQCTDVHLFRIGTCGGIGVKPGSVIVSNACVDCLFRPFYETPVLGRLVRREAVLDQELSVALTECRDDGDDFDVISGITMSAPGFFEAQCRLDGVLCDYTAEDKLTYLQSLKAKGVVNIEMEALLIASVCHRVGIKAGVVCVSVIDRFDDDEASEDHDALEHDKRPQVVVGRFIQHCVRS